MITAIPKCLKHMFPGILCKQMMTENNIPIIKPKRKIPEVPIHRSHDDAYLFTNVRKTSGSKKHNRHKFAEGYSYNEDSPRRNRNISDILTNMECDKTPNKISRKQLTKENLQLAKEKEDLICKFNELEDIALKKVNKLKEKISYLNNSKEDIERENVNIKCKYEDLQVQYQDVRGQLELCKICHSCEEFKDALENFSRENLMLRNSEMELKEDLNMMKTVVFRLNSQMERYQDKLRKLNIKDTCIQYSNTDNINYNEDNTSRNILSENHAGHHHSPITWGRVNTHTLGPLLNAFQETIDEKDGLIADYQNQLSNFTGKLKEILNENETLHIRLTEDDQCSIKLKDELNVLNKELQDLKDQNDILIKKCALKQDKIEEMLKCYETKIEQLKRDYNVLHEQYYKARTEIASLNEKNKSLIHIQEEFKNEKQNYVPMSIHNSSVNECKKWYEELKIQYEREKEKLKIDVDTQTKFIAELNTKITSIFQEKKESEEKVKNLEKHIKKGETKYLEMEHTLNEAQVAKTACKKQLHKAMNFAKDLVSEQETLLKALSQRHQENKAVMRIGADMALRMDTLKNQLKDVQRGAWQELSTVEERIQEQNDTIESLKHEHQKEVDRLAQIIKSQTDNAVLLKSQTTLPMSQYLLFRDKYME